MVDMDLYVQLKHLGLVAGYEEYKALAPDEAQAMLVAHQALVAKLEEEREKIRAEQEAIARKEAEKQKRIAELDALAAKYSRR